MRVEVIVAAGGKGLRLGGVVPKQYLPLGGIPLIEHCLRQFESHPRVDRVVVVVGNEEEFARHIGSPPPYAKISAVVPGGRDRQDSICLGLERCDPDSLVLVHDAVRPFVTADLITAVIEAAEKSGAAIPVVPVADTPKLLDANGCLAKTLDRSMISLSQTPQGFTAALLKRAHESAQLDRYRSTDDAALVERLGHPVTLVAGNKENIKITTKEDLQGAERSFFPYRTGIGFDQHPLGPGRDLILGGVKVPFDRGLEGHSDADVLVHAVCDALLGAARLGDIGSLFPDTDPANRDTRSLDFLEQIGALLADRGYRVVNLDVTLVAEAPMIASYRKEMEWNLAAALGRPPEAVSVKASRSGGLGPMGRGEGMAAWCVALLEGVS